MVTVTEFLNDIKSIDLASYIERHYHTSFKTEGRLLVSCCPFPSHNEKTASFKINPDKQTYKCFGCGEYGNVINFEGKMNNLKVEGEDFKDILRIIADKEGVDLKFEKENLAWQEYKDTMTNYAKRYNENLYNQNSKEALEYLYDRGLRDDIIKSFMIGYTPKDEYKNRKDIGGISGRISFPIFETKYHTDKIKVLGMGYRTLTDMKPKYINDVNQDGRAALIEDGVVKRPAQDINMAGVFVKGNCLYGYSHAAKYIKESNCCILVEGYMDVLAFNQAGIKNVVAVLNASFTEAQINTLRAICNNLIIFYDNDKTGIKSAYSYIPVFYSKGFNVKMLSVTIPGVKDGCDLCNHFKFDCIKILAYIKSNSVLFVLKVIYDRNMKLKQMIFDESLKILNDIQPLVDVITDENFKKMAQNELNKIIGI